MRWIVLSAAAIWGLALITVGANDAGAAERVAMTPSPVAQIERTSQGLASAPPFADDDGRLSTAALLGTVDPQAGFDAVAARERLRDALVEYGLSPAQATLRVSRLTEADLRWLDERLDEEPAGAGALGVVAVVFLILIITDAIGITNIFTFVR